MAQMTKTEQGDMTKTEATTPQQDQSSSDTVPTTRPYYMAQKTKTGQDIMTKTETTTQQQTSSSTIPTTIPTTTPTTTNHPTTSHFGSSYGSDAMTKMELEHYVDSSTENFRNTPDGIKRKDSSKGAPAGSRLPASSATCSISKQDSLHHTRQIGRASCVM